VDYQHLLFQLVIGNQHSKESVDFTTQKIYAKVTRPFFPPTSKIGKKQSGYARLNGNLQNGFAWVTPV